jgi:hypothetical protein
MAFREIKDQALVVLLRLKLTAERRNGAAKS